MEEVVSFIPFSLTMFYQGFKTPSIKLLIQRNEEEDINLFITSQIHQIRTRLT